MDSGARTSDERFLETRKAEKVMPDPGPPFRLDHRYDLAGELAKFAAQMEHITTDKQQWLESVMDGTESIEFYRGLLAGYAGVLALIQQMPMTEFVINLEQICAFLASKIRKMHALGEE